MKKIWMAAMVAALAFSAVACSDDDDTVKCFDPMVFTMMNDYKALGEDAVDVDAYDKTNLSDAEIQSALGVCETFATNLQTMGEKYASDEYSLENIKADFNNFKNTSTVCQVAKGLQGLLDGLNMTTQTENIKASATICAGIAKEATDGISDALQNIDQSASSLDTWSNVLQSAADYTAQLAEEEDAK